MKMLRMCNVYRIPCYKRVNASRHLCAFCVFTGNYDVNSVEQCNDASRPLPAESIARNTRLCIMGTEVI